jgi:monoamine oxidase
MGEHKVFSRIQNSFWKGIILEPYSQANIIQEMYDHSTADNSGFALKGFLNGATAVLSKEERQQKSSSN